MTLLQLLHMKQFIIGIVLLSGWTHNEAKQLMTWIFAYHGGSWHLTDWTHPCGEHFILKHHAHNISIYMQHSTAEVPALSYVQAKIIYLNNGIWRTSWSPHKSSFINLKLHHYIMLSLRPFVTFPLYIPIIFQKYINVSFSFHQLHFSSEYIAEKKIRRLEIL